MTTRYVPQSHVSVDVLALRVERSTGRLLLGVHRRPHAPFKGRLALPGVLLTSGETVRDAALRALAKIGVDTPAGTGQIVTFDEPNRDPRGPTLSIATWAVVDDDTPGDWVLVTEVPPLAFDHDRIVADCLPVLGQRLWHDPVLTRALTGPAFTSAEAAGITVALTGRAPDRGNLNRALALQPGLKRTTETVRRPGGGRPGSVWRWSA